MSIIEKALERLDASTEDSDKKPPTEARLAAVPETSAYDDDASQVPVTTAAVAELEPPTDRVASAPTQELPGKSRPTQDVSKDDVPVQVATEQPAAHVAEIPELDLSRISSTSATAVPALDLPRIDEEDAAPADAEEIQPEVEPRRVSAEVTVDVANLEAQGLLSPNIGNTPLAEQMRVIKRPLLLQAATTETDTTSNANLIMVASALPNEGKTSTAINLAISIAMERDKTVLLVDADVAKSDICNVLGVRADLGLTDLLDDPELSIPDIMLRTNIPKLSLLPAGNRHPNLTELFAGEDMQRLMLDLANRYPDRIIVIDSPPLLATSGASVLGSLVGQIVMVVEAIRTPQSAVAEAFRMLGPLDNIGIVLNKARERPSFSYGYGYGYDYYVKQSPS